ncbi:MAG TPA: hypothetical protein VIK08_11615 [Candidatus Limnocylindrales bacterium]
MTLIRRTNPLGELISLRRAMDRKLAEPFVRSRQTALSGDDELTLEVHQTADALHVDADSAAKPETSTERSA